MLCTSDEEVAASVAGARVGDHRGHKRRTDRCGGIGGGNGGGNDSSAGGHDGGTGRWKGSRGGVAGKAACAHHVGRQSRTDQCAAAIAKSQS